VVVTDEDGATDEQEIMVTVNEVNTAPILHPINNRTVTAGVVLSLNVTAEEDDLPAPDLVYSLVDAPDGAAIDPSTGQFTWRPTNRQAGVTHTFIVQVSDGQLTAEQELSVKVLAYYAGSNEPELVNQGTNVFINGKLVTIGSVTTSVVDGKQVLTTVVDEDQLSDRLESEADQSIISIPASSNADVVISQLSGTIIEKLQDKSARIEVVTNDASYTIPAKELDLSKTLGEDANWAEVKVNITIEHPSAETIALVNQASSQAGVTASSSPINFTVTIEYGGKIVELTQYTGYVERSIETANSEPITTGVVIDENGSMRHVPTEVAREGSGYRGIINSLTNSTYLLIYNEVEFIDVQNHWAKQAIENMAARLIINGAGDGSFKPDQDITRAEFAAILVRGLGLPAIGDAVGFKDVPANAWYAEVVQAAYQYGLINGYEDGTFRPNDKITREQAMLIISKAMKLTGLKGLEDEQSAEASLSRFTDGDTVSNWAVAGVADTIASGVTSGRTKEQLAPKANISRAEVAIIIQRLLQYSKLID